MGGSPHSLLPSSLHRIEPLAKEVPDGTWEVWPPTAALSPEKPPRHMGRHTQRWHPHALPKIRCREGACRERACGREGRGAGELRKKDSPWASHQHHSFNGRSFQLPKARVARPVLAACPSRYRMPGTEVRLCLGH